MSKLVLVEVAAEQLGSSRNSLCVTASQYKKKHGVYPKWYISNGKKGRGISKSWVDMEILHQNRQLARSIWVYSTDPDGFYRVMRDEFKMNDTYIATQMAKRSKKYSNVDSWKTFIHKHLFSLPAEVVYSLGSDMQSEFFKHSITVITLAKRKRDERNKQTW